ncbi:MAG: GNAT family N-acetyltransferase [Planctomycetes bacterium]|nr:GNAT family N-acetyltransferase [Planctomycetota bacterium]
MDMSHYDAVLRLWEETENIAVGESDSRENIERYLARNPGLSLVAIDGEVVVGGILCGHDGRRGFIWHLAVDGNCRGRGVGRELAERCLKSLADEKIEKCYIIVLENNEKGKAFWDRIGWCHASGVRLMFHLVGNECGEGC